jgi:hypothetical protein
MMWQRDRGIVVSITARDTMVMVCFLQDNLMLYARTAEIDCPSAVPGLSIPIGLAADQLPIGLQLHSRPGSPPCPDKILPPF